MQYALQSLTTRRSEWFHGRFGYRHLAYRPVAVPQTPVPLCPVAGVTDRLGGTWLPRLIWALRDPGPRGL